MSPALSRRGIASSAGILMALAAPVTAAETVRVGLDRIEAARFTPRAVEAAPEPKYAGQECAGLRVRVTDAKENGSMQLLRRPARNSAGVLLGTLMVVASAFAHPGSGIVADRHGNVYFVDTGKGVWKVDAQGRLLPHEGPAFHFMTIDAHGLFRKTRFPSGPSADIKSVGSDPTLIISSDYPLYVLEYLHVQTQDRRDWIPRIEKVSADGRASIVAAVTRR